MDSSAPHPLAVVTGASSGIGLELAKVFAEHGYDLLVTAEDRGIAAEMPAPFLAVYGASKAFVQSFAEALRNELKDTDITVTALQPGPTDTNFFARAHMEDTRVAASKKDDPAEVARHGFEALMKGKDHVVAGSAKNRVQSTLAQVLPETVTAEMHRKQTEPGSANP
jgi:uncharacterized protein